MPLTPSLRLPPSQFLEDSQKMMWSNLPRSFGNSKNPESSLCNVLIFVRTVESQLLCDMYFPPIRACLLN